MKCVAPVYTDNDMIAAIPGNVLERYVSQIPVGRLIPVNGGLEI